MQARKPFTALLAVSAALLGCRHERATEALLPEPARAGVRADAAGAPVCDDPASCEADPDEDEVATDGPAAGMILASIKSRRGDHACPAGMVHVVGEYCPDVRQRCLRYLDPPGGVFSEYRCAEYAKPATCASPKRVHKDYCIDRDEWAPPGKDLPENFHSWTHAKKICEGAGKRVCMQSEWQFACEGEEMRPYPYGWSRDASACNADNLDIYEAGGARIKDLRARHGEHPRCTSPFGVRDLSGNLEEFVTLEGSHPPRPAMMGAWWQPSRNHCRATQTGHDEYYNGRETGFRCCADPSK